MVQIVPVAQDRGAWRRPGQAGLRGVSLAVHCVSGTTSPSAASERLAAHPASVRCSTLFRPFGCGLRRSPVVLLAHGGAVPLRRSEMNGKAHDTRIEYLPVEADILGQAENILRKRLERLGQITDPTQASEFLRMRLGGLEHEEFHVVFLDTRHAIIAVEFMFRGTIDGAEVHPREVARAALRHNAAAVVLAHNHPSGNAEPSAADRAVTTRLKQALALLDIRVIDHIVVGETCVSLAARGWV